MDEIKKMKLKDIFNTLITVPKTIKLIFNIESKVFIKVIILSILNGIFPIILLYFSQRFINTLTLGVSYKNKIIVVFFLYSIISIISGIVLKISNYIENKFQLSLSFNLNYLIMEMVGEFELADIENPDIYNKIKKVTQEASYKPFQIFKAITGLITSITMLIAILIYISMWRIEATIILMIIPMISLILFLKIGQIEFIMQWKRAGDERKSWYLIHLLTNDNNFKEIKLYGLNNYLLSYFSNLQNRFIKENLKISKSKSIFYINLDILSQLVNIFIICMAIFDLVNNKIFIGNIVSMISAISMINTNSNSFIENTYIIYNSSLYMEELFELVTKGENSKDLKYKVNNSNHSKDINNIVIKDLEFSYSQNNKNVLDKVSLTLKKGELVAIVGKNGSGKSTLIKLISGLYAPTKGSIKYDNIDSKKLDKKFFKNKISVLFQDYTKYEMTLRENIGFGNIGDIYNDKKILDILEKLNLDFLKDNNKFNLDMQLGNWFMNGKQLSGGQWQKVALARTFFNNSSVYILDEPSASLDPIAEKEIFEEFIKLSKNKIAIFISHRLVAAKQAEKIIVLDNGKIVDIGTHEYLIKKCKVYKQIYNSEKYND